MSEEPEMPEEPEPFRPTQPEIVDRSVLQGVKKYLGILPDLDHFDYDIAALINGTFMTLDQLGVIKKDAEVVSAETTWAELVRPDVNPRDIRTFVFLSVRLQFDPPKNAFIVKSFEEQLKQLAWRLEVDYGGPIVALP